jgi:cystathionine beta-lyase/cystathionine gamma-synthase
MAMISDTELSRILFGYGEEEKNHRAISPSVVKSSNFVFPTIEEARLCFSNEKDHSVYSRGNNPTVRLLEKKVAALQGTEDALFFSSGSGAIAATVMAQLKAGDHVICVQHAYSWTYKLFSQTLKRFGVETTFVDGKDMVTLWAEKKTNTVLVYLESPTSVNFELQDIQGITLWAKQNNLKVVCDHSFGSPLCRKPTEFGVDLICHSATKFISGHSDVVAGVVCGSEEEIRKIFEHEYMTFGAVLSSDQAWQLIRSLRTLPLRMNRSIDTTYRVVDFLKSHPLVESVIWPFDETHPQFELAQTQFTMASPLFSILLKEQNEEAIVRFCESLRVFQMAVSWGGYESLILPSVIFKGSIYPKNLVRIYIGFEAAELLIGDLERGLASLFS